MLDYASVSWFFAGINVDYLLKLHMMIVLSILFFMRDIMFLVNWLGNFYFFCIKYVSKGNYLRKYLVDINLQSMF